VERTLVDWIKHHEGYRRFVYECPAGVLTVAFGRNLETVGISEEEADYLLSNDIKRCVAQLERYIWFTHQPRQVKDALINMCFNLGITRLLGFKKMIAALAMKDYTTAAKEALDSRWADQVGNRAKDISLAIREGGNGPRC
jgi:lysozyme